jgi:hypothetical protein
MFPLVSLLVAAVLAEDPLTKSLAMSSANVKRVRLVVEVGRAHMVHVDIRVESRDSKRSINPVATTARHTGRCSFLAPWRSMPRLTLVISRQRRSSRRWIAGRVEAPARTVRRGALEAGARVTFCGLRSNVGDVKASIQRTDAAR